MRSTSPADARVAARRAELVAELCHREGRDAAVVALREVARQPRKRSRNEVETAVELLKLQRTAEALEQGDITYDHAQVIAKAAGRGKIDEAELLEEATHQDVDAFSRTVRKHEQEQSHDGGVLILERQRRKRSASIKTSMEDGMTVLYGRFDPIAGAGPSSGLSGAR